MLKSVDFWCKLSSTFLVAEPRGQCFELFRTQNSQKFPGFYPCTPLGRAYSSAPDSPAAQWFFSSLHSSKNWYPPKIAGYSTVDAINYSHLKILKLKIYSNSLFGHMFLHPYYLMARFFYLNHLCFFSPFLSQHKMPNFFC